MDVTVRYFARVREIVGDADEVRVVSPGQVASDLFESIASEHPELAALRGHLRVAVNHEFVSWDAALRDGDEISFIPPVSGGMAGTVRFLVTDDAIDVDAVTDLVRRAAAGAVITFEGVVRDHTGDRDVVRLEYDAYVEMAERKLEETAAEAQQRWPDVFIAVHHRFGVLQIGEAAVAIAVSSPHRADAFDACRYVIDRLKEVVPIWKKEVSEDGSEWIGRGP